MSVTTSSAPCRVGDLVETSAELVAHDLRAGIAPDLDVVALDGEVPREVARFHEMCFAWTRMLCVDVLGQLRDVADDVVGKRAAAHSAGARPRNRRETHMKALSRRMAGEWLLNRRSHRARDLRRALGGSPADADLGDRCPDSKDFGGERVGFVVGDGDGLAGLEVKARGMRSVP
jgi:hypothetical protein